MAESAPDTEEWDDLHEMESQACGTLNHVLDEGLATCVDASDSFIDIVDNSPQPKQHRAKFVELGSSDDEDTNFHPPKSVVVNQFHFIMINSFICSFKYL